MVKNIQSGTQMPSFESLLQLSILTWMSYLTSLYFSFLVCKTSVMVASTSLGCFEDHMNYYM